IEGTSLVSLVFQAEGICGACKKQMHQNRAFSSLLGINLVEEEEDLGRHDVSYET
ncbi:hypothetical protein Tco_0376723, partial [Tanacetum coccineum]